MEDRLKLFTTVKQPLVKERLIKGGATATAGGTLLLLTGGFLPVEYLHNWGLVVFIVSLALIAYGWLPYKRLNQLQSKPNLLILDVESLSFEKNGRLSYSVPLRSIARCGHVDGAEDYGICLWLHKPLPEKVHIYDRSLNFRRMQRKTRKQHGCDLYIPFFSRRSYMQLADALEEAE